MFQSTTIAELNHQHLLNVINGSAFGLHIKGFAPPEIIQRAKDSLYPHRQQTLLDNQTEYVRVGKAFIEVKNDSDREVYHQVALHNIQFIRQAFKPFASPVDELRLLLEEIWPAGARLLQIDGKKCFVGVCRFQRTGVDLIPHTDNLTRHAPPQPQPLLKQLSANIYLDIPEQGGELEMWNIEPSEEEYRQLQGEKGYGLDRNTLPPPAAIIKPEPGDLILLNPRFIHAVRPSSQSNRVTLSSFVGYFGEDQPLAYWS